MAVRRTARAADYGLAGHFGTEIWGFEFGFHVAHLLSISFTHSREAHQSRVDLLSAGGPWSRVCPSHPIQAPHRPSRFSTALEPPLRGRTTDESYHNRKLLSRIKITDARMERALIRPSGTFSHGFRHGRRRSCGSHLNFRLLPSRGWEKVPDRADEGWCNGLGHLDARPMGRRMILGTSPRTAMTDFARAMSDPPCGRGLNSYPSPVSFSTCFTDIAILSTISVSSASVAL